MDPVDPDSKLYKKMLRIRASIREARLGAGMRDIDPQQDTEAESEMTLMDNVDFKNSLIW